eukprot:6514427-Alexandrium_andersonii.AAC.1
MAVFRLCSALQRCACWNGCSSALWLGAIQRSRFRCVLRSTRSCVLLRCAFCIVAFRCTVCQSSVLRVALGFRVHV